MSSAARKGCYAMGLILGSTQQFQEDHRQHVAGMAASSRSKSVITAIHCVFTCHKSTASHPPQSRIAISHNQFNMPIAHKLGCRFSENITIMLFQSLHDIYLQKPAISSLSASSRAQSSGSAGVFSKSLSFHIQPHLQSEFFAHFSKCFVHPPPASCR